PGEEEGDDVERTEGPPNPATAPDGIPTEAVVQEVDHDEDPETPAEEYITIQVRGHARKIRLRRKRTERADGLSHDELAEAGVEVTSRELLDDGWRFDEFDESKIERDESGRFSSSGMTSTDDGHRVKLKIQHTKDFGPKVGVVP